MFITAYQSCSQTGATAQVTANRNGERNALHTQITDTEGNPLGTAVSPMRTSLVNSNGTPMGSSTMPIHVASRLRDESNQPLGTFTNPIQTTCLNQRDNIAINNWPLTQRTDPHLDEKAIDGTISLSQNVVVEIKVGSVPLANRKQLLLIGTSNSLFFGFSVTTQHMPLIKDQPLFLPIGPGIRVWIKTTVTSGSVSVTEFA